MHLRHACRSSTPRAHLRGFTLIEALIVMTILAIAAAIGGPSFTAFIVDQRARAAATDLMTAILAARSEAIKRNADVTITPAVVGGAANWGAGWVVTAPGGVQIDSKDLSDTRLQGPSVPATIVFNGTGRMTTAGSVSIELRNPDAAAGLSPRCVTIDLGGRPQTKRGACA